MNRRDFLRRLATGVTGLVAGAELDVDKLLWQPGAKTIFIPDVPKVMTIHVTLPQRFVVTQVCEGLFNPGADLARQYQVEFPASMLQEAVRALTDRIDRAGMAALYKGEGWGHVLQKGDIIEFAGVPTINPPTREECLHVPVTIHDVVPKRGWLD